MIPTMKSRPRRKFLKILIGGAATTLLGLKSAKALKISKSENIISGVFKHHVFFWLKYPENKSDNEKFLNNLKTFLSKVDVIVGGAYIDDEEFPYQISFNSR